MLVHSPVVIKKQKEYEFVIDPYNMDPVDTICAYIREIYRLSDNNERVKELARAAYDKANRMNRGLVDHRRHLLRIPEQYRHVEKGNSPSYE